MWWAASILENNFLEFPEVLLGDFQVNMGEVDVLERDEGKVIG